MASDMAGPQNACMLRSIICVKLRPRSQSQTVLLSLYWTMSAANSALPAGLGQRILPLGGYAGPEDACVCGCGVGGGIEPN